jgi:hypothetical protein
MRQIRHSNINLAVAAELSRDIQGQSMHTADQISAKGCVNGTMAANPAHRCEGRGTDNHVKMSVPPFAPSPMTTVTFAVIDHFQAAWIKTFAQLRFYFACNRHFYP